MNTVSETKKLANDDWIWFLLIFVVLTFGLFTADNLFGKIIIAAFLGWLILIFIQKKTLRLTVDNETVVVEQNIGWFINRIKKTELKSTDISAVIIHENHYRTTKYFLELNDKSGKRTIMFFMDLHKRAEGIKLLLDILNNKSVKLSVSTNIYDPAFEDLKYLIEKKYSLVPNKFNPTFCFDGKNYI